ICVRNPTITSRPEPAAARSGHARRPSCGRPRSPPRRSRARRRVGRVQAARCRREGTPPCSRDVSRSIRQMPPEIRRGGRGSCTRSRARNVQTVHSVVCARNRGACRDGWAWNRVRMRWGEESTTVRYRVLIVDDDPLNLDALARVLGDEYDLIRAADGDEALRVLTDQIGHIDLILSDKAMPRMSGVKLLEEAKALNPEIMRVILTAYPDAADLAEAINRGEVYRYVTKPWSPDELRVVVAQALERYQLARDNAELI